MVEILRAKVECKEIDTNHWQKWVSNDFSSPNVDAISFPKKKFASHVEANSLEGTWNYTSYSDDKHLERQTSTSDQR